MTNDVAARGTGHAVVMMAARAVGAVVRTFVLYDDGAWELHDGSAVGRLVRRGQATEPTLAAWATLLASLAWRASTTERTARAPEPGEIIVTARGGSLSLFEAPAVAHRGRPSSSPPSRRVDPRAVVESEAEMRAWAQLTAEALLDELDGQG